MNDMTIESNFKDAPYAEWLAEGVVVPDQLVVLPSGRLKRRRDLYAHDQAALAAAARRAEYALAARYEGALAEPFLRWTEAR
jgi:hypothetical protein